MWRQSIQLVPPVQGATWIRRSASLAVASLVLSGAAWAWAAPVATAAELNTAAAAVQVSAAAPSASDPVSTARSTGVPQVIDALTSATSITTVNPDGTYTTTTSAVPERVRRGTTWEPMDLTLTVGPDGRVEPVAGPSDLSLSDGGNSLLASRAGDTGYRLSVTTTGTALPTPTLSGSTATYSNVLPGVDLALTATTNGGFSQVWIVKSKDAATDPALADLSVDVTTPGLALAADTSGGGISASDASGRLRFDTPTPIMWDSSGPAAASNPTSTLSTAATATATSRSLATAAPAADSSSGTSTGGADPLVSSAQQAGAQATTSPMTTSVSAPAAAGSASDTRSVHVHPNLGLLTAPSTVYPVYIDPYFTETDSTSHWDWLQSGCPTKSNFDGTSYLPGVGKNAYDGCTSNGGLERTLYELDAHALAGATVNSSTLETWVGYSAQFCPANPANAPAVAITETTSQPFDAGSTWNSPPGTYTAYPADTENVVHCQGQGNVQVNFNVTQAVAATASHSTPSVYFRLTGDEGNATAFKRFTTAAKLVTNYDRPPNVPSGLTLNPALSNGYIGATNAVTSLQLGATVSSSLSGQTVHGDFALTDTTSNATRFSGSSATVTTSGPVSVQVPASALIDGHHYAWTVQSDDGILTSGAANGTGFTVDATPPALPQVTSKYYPPPGTTPETTLHAGQGSTFTLSSTDTSPVNGSASGIARIDYSLSPFSSPSAPTPGIGAGSSTSANAAVNVTPTAWGTNTLYVRAVDQAGNISPTTQYHFYVPSNPATTGTQDLGDVTGDSAPDVVTTYQQGTNPNSGQLMVFPSTADPAQPLPTTYTTRPDTTKPFIGALASDAPDGVSWSGTLISHHGSFIQQNSDDLVATKGSRLEIYLHQSTSPTFTSGSVDDVTHPCQVPGTCATNPGAIPQSWSGITDMVVAGAVTNIDTSTAAVHPSPDLVVIQNGAFWLYPIASPYATSFNAPIPLTLAGNNPATSQLLAPGDVVNSDGSAGQDGTADLWVRDTTTGTITQYAGNASGSPYFGGSGTVVATGFTSSTFAAVTTIGDASHPNNLIIADLTQSGSLETRTIPAGQPTSPPPSYTAFSPSPITTSTFGSSVIALENVQRYQPRSDYYSVAPFRLVDTRPNGISAGTINRYKVTGHGGVPASGPITAVSINVTATNSSVNSWLRVGPNGPGRSTSTIDTVSGTSTSNSAVVSLDSGYITVYLATGTTDIIIDVTGYYMDQTGIAPGSGTGGVFKAVNATRICDSRYPSAAGTAPGCANLPVGTVRTITVAGLQGIPANATDAVINITIPAPAASGYVDAWATAPAPNTPPGISVINPAAGRNYNNTTHIKLGQGGAISIENQGGSTEDVIIDIMGFDVPEASLMSGGSFSPNGYTSFVPVDSSRILQTNDPLLNNGSSTPLSSAAALTLQVAGATDTVGATTAPATSSAAPRVCSAVLNMAAFNEVGGGDLSILQHGAANTNVGSLDYSNGISQANGLTIPTDSNGAIDIHNNGTATTHALADIVGYYTPLPSGTC